MAGKISTKSILSVVVTVLGCKAIDIPLNPSGFFGILTANAPRVSEILSHGCVCSSFGINGFNSQIGNVDALDEIDSICKDWKSARKCLRMIGGACELNDLTGSYGFTGCPIFNVISRISACFRVRASSISQIYPRDATPCRGTNCEAAADACDGACCQVDIFYVSMINEALTNNPSWTADSPTVDKCPFDFGNGISNDACCGTAPAVYMYKLNIADACKICTCPNGIGATVNCLVNNSQQCESCLPGFKLNSGQTECERITCGQPSEPSGYTGYNFPSVESSYSGVAINRVPLSFSQDLIDEMVI